MSDSDDARDSMLDSSVALPEHVVHRAFPTETVVLNLRTGKYHGLNPTGAQMFETLMRASSVRDAVAQLAAKYQRPVEEIEPDVIGFCEQLLERELIVLSADGDG